MSVYMGVKKGHYKMKGVIRTFRILINTSSANEIWLHEGEGLVYIPKLHYHYKVKSIIHS